jgi:nucleotide-binding universal stress UspA family protein
METRTPKQILVATDFSAGSDEALEQAIDIARPSGAAVEIVHVLEMSEEFPFGAGTVGPDYGTLFEGIELQLSRRAAHVAAAGLACTTKIIEGRAVAQITQRGRDIGADLIVVGTHGRTGLAHVVLGSVAERVVRRAPCPVLTVPFSRKAA